MSSHRVFSQTVVLVAAIAAGWPSVFLADACAETTFFVQRHGSLGDTGHNDFLTEVGPYAIESFDSPEYVPDQTETASLTVGGFEFSMEADWDGPFTPIVGWSPAFNVPGEIEENALVAGYVLNISTAQPGGISGFGAWIFDDRRALDSAYLIEVVESDGAVSRVILENEIPLNSNGHEIEGFAGAVSDIGIVEFRIIAVDPITHQPHADFFEVDNLVVATTPPAVPEVEEDWSDTPADVTLPPRDKSRGKHACKRRDTGRQRWIKRHEDRKARSTEKKNEMKKSCRRR